MCDKKIEFTKLYLAYAQNKVSTIASFLQNLLQATKKKPPGYLVWPKVPASINVYRKTRSCKALEACFLCISKLSASSLQVCVLVTINIFKHEAHVPHCSPEEQ